MSPRRYRLGRRKSAAESTRSRILEAARSLIAGKGDLAGFSMEAVAVQAGVSRMTVYNQFESQPHLLEAVADALAERGGMHRLAGAFLAPRLEDAVGVFVSTFVGFWASDRVLLRRLRAMGVLVPSVYRKVRERDAWRREAARNLLARFGDRVSTRVARDPAWAADLLATLTSFEVFDMLCDETHPPDELARSIAETVLAAWGATGPSRPSTRARGRRSATT
ncbi:MAG TPA: helix-turn-helix domain-containing protein [Thermoplasmata archaeon]|jgi:AcrR family transcriptional regulator|nr:helix-turn-helix domain-containing protein [Thermoplasmata archaeon]